MAACGMICFKNALGLRSTPRLGQGDTPSSKYCKVSSECRNLALSSGIQFMAKKKKSNFQLPTSGYM